MKGQKKRLPLSLKMNLFIIVLVLSVSLGLVFTSYRVYCRKVDALYFAQTERAAEDVLASSKDSMKGLLQYYRTDEFAQARQQAAEAEDESILQAWMTSRPCFYKDITTEELLNGMIAEGTDAEYIQMMFSLYGDYLSAESILLSVRDIFDVANVYLQFDENGLTYNVADPAKGVLGIGTAEKAIPVFAAYGDNADVPPTVYQGDGGWLCTTRRTIRDTWTDEILGTVGVDIDMNEVMKERHWFLMNSFLFILAELAAAIVIGVWLMHRAVTRPLNMLAKAATGFAKDEKGYTKADVIRLPIRSRDEIGDLYREIQSMQSRIVDYTDHITQITADKERVNTELRMATNIQASMLPGVFPPFPERREFDLFASMNPAKEVGGDFYDFFMTDEDHLCTLIADVSDKGVPAALFMMSSKILINYRAQQGGTPGEILTAVNAQICKNNKSKMFVTVWLGILNVKTGQMVCTNAGHEYPAIRGSDGVFRIFHDKHGLVVGGAAKSKYRDYELTLAPGDAVFVYTDGVPEANNAAGEFYGMERMEAALNRAAKETPQGILASVKADVDQFVQGAKQFDDLTMLCLEYRGYGEQLTGEEHQAADPMINPCQASGADASAVAALACELWPEHSAEEMTEETVSLLAREDAAVFLYREQGEGVGFAQCQLRRDYVEGAETSPVGYLEGIYVCEGMRRRGIARRLLSACESWARARGCTEFASDCGLDNTDSQSFHRAAGFEEANRIVAYVKKL
ncbi:MAG: GNAT family N-acetyltransferase [Clostridia bacterium]|nr:GNAT family N-acetyltransferase [Clostridia bacterium]